jgi:hypothetical protein
MGKHVARLLEEARTAEWTSGDVVRELLVGVSVSRADDGTPVTGLTAENFRVAAQLGDLSDFAIDQVSEWEWEPGDVEPAGCYQLSAGWHPFADGVRLRTPPPNPSASQRLQTRPRVALRIRDPGAHLRRPRPTSYRPPRPDDR